MKILTAFDYMLRGLAVKISEDLRNTVRGSEINMYYVITAVNDTETVNLREVGGTWEFKEVKLKDIE